MRDILKIKEFFNKHIQFFTYFLLNILFLVIYIFNIQQFPGIWIDEGYFSNPAYDLVENAKFRTYIYKDFLRLEEFTFWQPPFYILLVALFFKLFGVSLISGRIVSVILALVVINVFFSITSKHLKKHLALILTLLLGTFPFLFISGRQIRMDIATSAFTFLSFYFLFFKYYKHESNNKKKGIYLVLAGIFSAFALLSHPNGLFSIILNFIGIIFYDIPLKPKVIFSKETILSLKSKSKTLLIFGLTILIIALPYLILIFLYFDIFTVQFMGSRVGLSMSNIWGNILNEYFRYYSMALSYSSMSFLNLFPLYIKILFLAILFFMFFLGILTVFLLTLKEDHKNAKIIFIYIIGMIILFTVIVSNKTSAYICIFTPYYFLSVMYFFSYKNFLFSQLRLFKKTFINKFISFFNEKLIPIYKVFWIGTLFLAQITILINSYIINQNQNPYHIREVLEKNPIAKNEVIVGNPSFYVPLYDYNFIHFDALRNRLSEGESFEDVINEYDPKFFIYDARQRSLINNTDFTELIEESESFFENNCTLLEKFNSTISRLDPIYLYEVNN